MTSIRSSIKFYLPRALMGTALFILLGSFLAFLEPHLWVQAPFTLGGPVFQSKSLGEWLHLMGDPAATSRLDTQIKAELAVKSIGTSGIPFLQKLADMPVPRLMPNWLEGWSLGQHIGHALGFNDRLYHARLCDNGFVALGTNVIPILLRLPSGPSPRAIEALPLRYILSFYDGTPGTGANVALMKTVYENFNAFLDILIAGSELERREVLDFFMEGPNSQPEYMFWDIGKRFSSYQEDVLRLLSSTNREHKLLAIRVSPFCGIHWSCRVSFPPFRPILERIAADSDRELAIAAQDAMDRIFRLSSIAPSGSRCPFIFPPNIPNSGKPTMLRDLR